MPLDWQKSHGILSGKTENILSSNQIKVKNNITNGHLFNRCSFVNFLYIKAYHLKEGECNMDLDIGRLLLAAAIIFLPMYFFQKLADWSTANQKIDHPDMDEQRLMQIGTENRAFGFVAAMIVSGMALLVFMGFMFLLVIVALYIVLIFPLFRIMRRV